MDGRVSALQMRIGLFVLVSLGVFLGIIYLLGAQARYFERKYTLAAEFTEVGGLMEGATVRLAGVQVGRVTDVALPREPGGKVRVTLSIARRFSERIRKNSEARIVTQGLLGDRLVEITMGTAEFPALPPGATLVSREPFEIGTMFVEGSQTLASLTRLATSVQAALDRLDKSGAIDDLGATLRSTRGLAQRLEGLGGDGTLDDLSAMVKSGRRLAERVERGPGWLHALIYEEPAALRRLDGLLASVQDVLDRTRSGQNAVGVLLSAESARAARSLLAAMEALGKGAERAPGEEGLLSALLFDPQYRSVAADLQAVTRNLRDVTERVNRGQGLLGSLVSDRSDEPMGQAAADFRQAMANLRTITDRLRAGEGTLGGLLEDPTVYENLAAFLEGAERSLLLRALIRSTITSGTTAPGEGKKR